VVLAEITNPAPIHSNFRHTPFNGQDLAPGVRLDGNWVYFSPTIIADIDGNTANGREVVVGTADGYVNAFSGSGAKLWSYRVASCSRYRGFNTGDEIIQGAPAVGDLNGDGRPEVVVGYGTRAFLSEITCDGGDTGGVVAIDGASGALTWRYTTSPDNMNNFILNGTIASPSLADVDGNGTLEVGFGSLNNNVYLLDASGARLWKYRTFDTVWSTPAFADVNGDGRKEMLIGTDFGPNNCVPNTPGCKIPGAYGFLYAFDTAGGPGENREFGQGYLWRQQFDQVIWSSPAVGDLDRDGTLEVVIGSGANYPTVGNWVKVLDAATGTVERTLVTPARTPSVPALGDLNGDGTIEIVAASGTKVIAWNAAGSVVWESTPTSPEDGNTTSFEANTNSPIIADLDGNGSLEVAITARKAIAILRGDNGEQLTANSNADMRRSLWMWLLNLSTPAVGDLDGDGSLELASGGSNTHVDFNFPSNGPGFLYAWGDFASWLGSPPAGGRQPYAAPWPMAHGGSTHIGALASGIASPGSLSSFLTTGTSQTFTFPIRADNGEPLNWSVLESDPSGIVSLSPTSGTSEKLVVTVTAPGAPGDYTATLTVSGGGFPNRTITVAVTSTSADVTRMYLPTARE
jgi:hypothetical protein